MSRIISRYDHLFFRIGKYLGVGPWVIKGIALHESRLDETAHGWGPSERGFYERYIRGKAKFTGHRYYDQPRIIAAGHGLMQIQYTTATLNGVGFPFEGDWWKLYTPARNIYYGSRYFRKQLKRYGNLSQAIAAYNAGTATWISDPDSPKQGHFKNQPYVNQVQQAISAVTKDWKKRGIAVNFDFAKPE